MVIQLTDFAAEQLKTLLEGKKMQDGAGLRLGVEKGGCAGMQYSFTLGDAAKDDQIIEKNGAKVYVDKESLTYLDGCTIDYTDELAGAGFRIKNPNAVRSCGCGTSFETPQK
ncbi:MAG: iron-sulfur cluster assembly accessory protein [Chthoniobacterales bacterium]